MVLKFDYPKSKYSVINFTLLERKTPKSKPTIYDTTSYNIANQNLYGQVAFEKPISEEAGVCYIVKGVISKKAFINNGITIVLPSKEFEFETTYQVVGSDFPGFAIALIVIFGLLALSAIPGFFIYRRRSIIFQKK